MHTCVEADELLQDQLLQWDFLRSWAPELHKLYPAQFQAVTKLLVLGASQQAGNRSNQSGALLAVMHSVATWSWP